MRCLGRFTGSMPQVVQSSGVSSVLLRGQFLTVDHHHRQQQQGLHFNTIMTTSALRFIATDHRSSGNTGRRNGGKDVSRAANLRQTSTQRAAVVDEVEDLDLDFESWGIDQPTTSSSSAPQEGAAGVEEMVSPTEKETRSSNSPQRGSSHHPCKACWQGDACRWAPFPKRTCVRFLNGNCPHMDTPEECGFRHHVDVDDPRYAPDPSFLHPCLNVFQEGCAAGDSCVWAKFPRHVCLSHLRGKCSRDPCRDRHDVDPKDPRYQNVGALHPCTTTFGHCQHGSKCLYLKLPADACIHHARGNCKHVDNPEKCQYSHNFDVSVVKRTRHQTSTEGGDHRNLAKYSPPSPSGSPSKDHHHSDGDHPQKKQRQQQGDTHSTGTHPCISTFGFCKHGVESCTLTKFPADACLYYIWGTCNHMSTPERCKRRHDFDPKDPKYVSRPSRNVTATALPQRSRSKATKHRQNKPDQQQNQSNEATSVMSGEEGEEDSDWGDISRL